MAKKTKIKTKAKAKVKAKKAKPAGKKKAQSKTGAKAAGKARKQVAKLPKKSGSGNAVKAKKQKPKAKAKVPVKTAVKIKKKVMPKVKAKPKKKAMPPPAPAVKPLVKPKAMPVLSKTVKSMEKVKEKKTNPVDGNGNGLKLRYSDKDLAVFKEIILDKLSEARKDLELLRSSMSHLDDHGTDDTSPTFKLMEDGSDVLTKEETAQLAARQQKFIKHLEDALVRIENKTYGICRVTGNLIPKERLKVVPHATLSIEAKQKQF